MYAESTSISNKSYTKKLLQQAKREYFDHCNGILLQHSTHNFMTELNYLKLKSDHITEIFLTKNTRQIDFIVQNNLDSICPSRELNNYLNLPRQCFWSEIEMLIPKNTNYRDYINRLNTGCLKPILATSYINTDNSVSVFFHEVESKLEAYQLFRDRSYILSLRSIEKDLHSNPDLINNSTYSKRLVRPLNLGRIKNFVNNKVRFTKREYSILNCIYNGLYSSKMIALKLKCSYRTIDEYLTNLKIKLNVPNKYALIMEVSNNYLHY